jgi:cytochrome c oxidase subunit II
VYKKLKLLMGSFIAFAFSGGHAIAEMGLNLPKPVSGGAQDIFDLHMLTTTIATTIMVIITLVIIYTIVTFRKDKNYEPDQEFHKSWFGRWAWLLVPILVLGIDLSIASSANSVLEKLWLAPTGDDVMDIKVTGHQWWWEYEYPKEGLKIESRLKKHDVSNKLYLRDVDNRLVLPVNTKIRFLQTSADVLHAFWVPAIMGKKDAIPGYVSETWAEITEEGVFRGQCAEICGGGHGYMPIVVEVVSKEKFAKWVESKKSVMMAKAAEALSDKTWTKDELMAKGEELYNLKCAGCHNIAGTGMMPVFPPLKGSKMVTSDLSAHIDIVLKGKKGTAMSAWSALLNDLEAAAIITYERNAWGNNTGDVIQPKDIKTYR